SALLRPEGLKNEENGSNFDAGRFLKSTDGSIAGKHPAISDHPELAHDDSCTVNIDSWDRRSRQRY
ncbi:hypothetical protein, partial [Pseudomonas sp. EA_15y_Pfl2_R67]|uniref:hypothetical protein n=1 Tax=Pseudomonas sp. EA_15y_Pfl2_R67 TaxID=3088687 RepID=UPI0030D78070